MSVAGGEAIERPEARGEERRAAGVACGAHALHDGYTDLIVVMLPIWQAEFGLGYGELGLMRGLFAALVIGGLGASTQHPLASALMARAFAGARSMKALGTYNFAGDIGKMTVPAVASVMLVAMPWRPALALLGVLGLVGAVAVYLVTPRYGSEGTAAA